MTTCFSVKITGALAGLCAFAWAGAAVAQMPEVTVGVTISATGQGAALGVPQRNTLQLIPAEISGAKLKIIQLDDASDPTAATTNARRLVSEDKVDVLIGSSITPTSLAVANVAAEAQTLQFSLSPMPVAADKQKWSAVMPQPVSMMAGVLFDHMKKNNVKNLAMIGFSDSWGDLWAKEFKNQGETAGLKLVADERYARADTSVAGQVLKLVAAKPDAVLVAASGTAAALPQIALRERGFTGAIYQTHGAVTRDFIRIAGKSAEDVIMASGPMVAAELQNASSLTRAPGLAYVTAYEAKFGQHSRTQFGAHIYDSFEVLKRIVPVALKTAKPGTQEFREALRLALIGEKEIAATHGVYNFTATDRFGTDERARILITVKDGNWAVLP